MQSPDLVVLGDLGELCGRFERFGGFGGTKSGLAGAQSGKSLSRKDLARDNSCASFGAIPRLKHFGCNELYGAIRTR